jgi:hypothetical protein
MYRRTQHAGNNHSLRQGCTDPRLLVYCLNEHYVVAPIIFSVIDAVFFFTYKNVYHLNRTNEFVTSLQNCGSLVWNLLHSTPYGAKNLKVAPRFLENLWTMCICGKKENITMSVTLLL